MNSVYVRLLIYVLSPVLAALAAAVPGLGVGYADGVVTIHVETLAAAIVAGLGLSGAVFARWGTR